jgi:thiol-disulfide isomerase/thioredoxin
LALIGIAAIIGFAAIASASIVGEAAPALIVPELSGNQFDLAKLRGKVVVINFWATWCPPCRDEMPALNAFYQRHHAEGVEMLGLSADRAHARADVVKVMQSFSYPAAMLSDAATDGFGPVADLPVTIVVGPNGVVRNEITPSDGPLTEERLSAVVEPMLMQNPQGKSSP